MQVIIIFYKKKKYQSPMTKTYIYLLKFQSSLYFTVFLLFSEISWLCRKKEEVGSGAAGPHGRSTFTIRPRGRQEWKEDVPRNYKVIIFFKILNRIFSKCLNRIFSKCKCENSSLVSKEGHGARHKQQTYRAMGKHQTIETLYFPLMLFNNTFELLFKWHSFFSFLLTSILSLL